MHEATQVARIHDAVAFLAEANLTRNAHLAEFQGNAEKWAANHLQKVETLEQQRMEDQRRLASLEQRLIQAQDELIWVATAMPLSATPVAQLTLGNPLLGRPPRRQRPPAIPANDGGTGGNSPPQRPPQRTTPPSPSPPPNEGDGDLYERNLPMGR